jgi:ssDNA-binding Zn-finger/Zn-ribbon topoisomerase 1
MNCPNCKTEMIKGALVMQGHFWSKSDVNRNSFWQRFGTPKSLEPVVAWKCPTCNKVELSMEIEK